MYFVDIPMIGNMPNITKREREEAKQKGEEGGGMQAL